MADKVFKEYPIMKEECRRIKLPMGMDRVLHVLYLENKSQFDWNEIKDKNEVVSYIKSLNCYMEERRGIFPKMLFLVTEDTIIASKIAAVMAWYCQQAMESEEREFPENEMDYDFFREYEENEEDICGEEDIFGCAYVDLSRQFSGVIGMQENIISQTAGIENEVVLFDGLKEGTQLQEQIEAVKVSKGRVKLIHIQHNQMEERWALKLREQYKADVLDIEEVPDLYYENLVQDMLSREKYNLEKDLSIKEIVRRARIRTIFDEEQLIWLIEQAMTRADKKRLKKEDFKELGRWGESAKKQLERMTGLLDLKDVVEEYCALAYRLKEGKTEQKIYKHMVFMGNPGSGKTTAAKLFAEILAENGIGNAKYIECSRKDLIGKYVGYTAHMVAQKFDEARGGVLFVDEAGFFLNQEAGGFVQEALKEFIRYMELYSDVIVIFAMYENEVEDFLNLDEGMASRITEKIHFCDYSSEELWKIMKDMVAKQECRISDDCEKMFVGYMEECKKRKNFGNAREVRKLVQACIRMMCVRCMQYKGRKSDEEIKQEDLKCAIGRLERKEQNQRQLGFYVPDR